MNQLQKLLKTSTHQIGFFLTQMSFVFKFYIGAQNLTWPHPGTLLLSLTSSPNLNQIKKIFSFLSVLTLHFLLTSNLIYLKSDYEFLAKEFIKIILCATLFITASNIKISERTIRFTILFQYLFLASIIIVLTLKIFVDSHLVFFLKEYIGRQSWFFEKTIITRWPGTFYEPAIFGRYLVCLAVLFYQSKSNENPFTELLIGFLGLITLSDQVIIAFILIFSSQYIYTKRVKYIGIISIFIITLSFSTYMKIGGYQNHNLLKYNNSNDKKSCITTHSVGHSYSERIKYAKCMIEHLTLTEIFLGNGVATASLVSHSKNVTSRKYHPPQSAIIEIIFEFGVIGLTGIALYLLSFLNSKSYLIFTALIVVNFFQSDYKDPMWFFILGSFMNKNKTINKFQSLKKYLYTNLGRK
jgi:hypothetical protein